MHLLHKFFYIFVVILILLVIIIPCRNLETFDSDNQNELLIIHCIFGKRFTKLHSAPSNSSSFFFTNNPSLKDEIIKKGWNYVYVNKPLYDDEIISALQSKYIKFLIFLKDYPQFKKYKKIIYFDHKLKTNSSFNQEVETLINNNLNKSLIICKSPSLKTKIQHEIDAAMGQSRYVKNMDKTKSFIRKLLVSGEISENVRICSTGFLIYINRETIKNLLESVYNKCIEHEQPECQIYWSVFSQKYQKDIKEIEWSDLGFDHIVPT